MHATRDTSDVIKLNQAGRRVMRSVMPLNVSCVKMRSDMLAKSLSLLLFFCLTVTAAAQQASSDATGKLAGMVSDPVGAYFPGVRIIIQGKRLKRELRSGDDGTYSVDLLPGTYKVHFEYPRCISVRQRVQITRGAVTKLDVVIQLDPKYTETVY